MIYFLFFMALNALGAESKNAFEKSYPRDNSYCTYQKKKVELLIRGENKFTEPTEKGYGDLLFYRHPQKNINLLPLNESHSNTYRFFNGMGSLCSKSHGYPIDNKRLAVLFLKENKPFKDKLAIQFFDLKDLTPLEFIETNYISDEAKKTANGFAVRTFADNHNPDMGKVTIAGDIFSFQEMDFPQWVAYSEKGFELNPELTYENFRWKKHFKDQADFFSVTEWNLGVKKFVKSTFFLAINHKLNKECLLFIEKKQAIIGNESWRCQTK